MKNLDLNISYSSPYELELILKDQAKLEWEYHKKYAEAVKEEDDLLFQLEILTGEIVGEICKERKVPPSAKSEVRRTEVPLDKRYQIIKRRHIKAVETSSILRGATFSLTSRRYCLIKLVELTTKQLGDGLTIYNKKNTDKLIKEGAKDYREEE